MKRDKEPIKKENNDKNINLFVCGPTVYDDAHIGHGRTYIAFDMIKSYLEFIGYSVFYIENITDIDNKIVNRAKKTNINSEELANYYENRFKEDMEKINVNSVNHYPRATYHLNEVYNQIQILIDKGYAYETETGVYFETSKFKDFGKLSNRKLDKLNSHRIAIDPTKKDPKDFALWKKTSEIPYYESKWNKGRPGWHIEDTAITEKYFGPQYDIHGGGLDLIFPHHDAEIAQMEAISGKKPMVKYWMHTGFLNVDGVKMSKSLGNFITIRELLKNWDPMVYRLFVLSTHYRSPIDFSSKSLEQASKNLKRLKKAIVNLKKTILYLEKIDLKDINLYSEKLNQLNSVKTDFFTQMDDDFNTPRALAIVLSFTKVINSYTKNINDKNVDDRKIDIRDMEFLKKALDFLKDFEYIFKLDLFEENEKNFEDNSAQLLEIISYTREKLRKENNYKLSDDIRTKLNKLNINIEDK